MLGIRAGYAWDKVGIRSANVEIRTTLGRNKATKWSRDKVTKLSRLKTNYRISQVLIRVDPHQEKLGSEVNYKLIYRSIVQFTPPPLLFMCHRITYNRPSNLR